MFSYDTVTLILFIFLMIIIIPVAITVIISVYYFCFLGICTMIEEIAEQIARIKIKKTKKFFQKPIDKNKEI